MDLRKFDVFPKLDRQYRVSTSFGGILSIASITVTIILFFSEIHTYLNPPIRQRFIVDNTKPMGISGKSSNQRKLSVNLDIEFPNVPCYLLHIDVVDPISQLDLPMESISNNFARLDKTGKNIGDFHPEKFLEPDNAKTSDSTSCYAANNTKVCKTCKDVVQAHKNQELLPPPLSTIAQCASTAAIIQEMKDEGCKLTSAFQTVRLASEFHVAPGYNYLYKGWHSHNTTILGSESKDLNLTHIIRSFRFNRVDGKFPLDNVTSIQTGKGSWRVVYSADIMDNTYTANKYELMDPPKFSSGVYFRYAINPVSAIDYYDTEPFLHLCTRLLTVIGAVLAAFRLLDSFLFLFYKPPTLATK